MGTFKSSRIINGTPSLIPQAGRDVMDYFKDEGFDVNGVLLMSGGYDISVSRGNMFKAVLGMNTALKILIRPQGGQIAIEAGVGVFGQQAIPTVISMLFFWPVLVTQIWGVIQQSSLDEKAIEIAEKSIRQHCKSESGVGNAGVSNSKYCTQCGTRNDEGVKFCRECGTRI